jgi:hypothetical protein
MKPISTLVGGNNMADAMDVLKIIDDRKKVASQSDNSTLWGDIAQHAPGALRKIVAPLGVGGAALIHGLESGANYLRAPFLPRIEGSEERLRQNVEFMANEYGIGKGGGAPGVAPTVATNTVPAPAPVPVPAAQSGGLPEPMTPPVAGSAVTAPTPDNGARLNAIYDKLKTLKPEQLKKFMNKNPGFSGIGYSESINPDTGKKEIKTFVENPADKPQEPMTIAQSDALARMITAQGHYGLGTAALQERKDARAANIQSKSDQLAVKGSEDMQKIIGSYGKTVDQNGTPAVNPELAYFKIGLNNTPLPPSLTDAERKEHHDAIKQATEPFWSEVRKLETNKYKRKATQTEINSLAKTYQTMRFGAGQ